MKQHLYTKLLILYFVLGGICFLLLSSGGSYLVEKRLERSTGESLYRAASQMISGNELRQSVKDPENASLSLALSSAAAFQNADFWVMDTDGTVQMNSLPAPVRSLSKISGLQITKISVILPVRFMGHSKPRS